MSIRSGHQGGWTAIFVVVGVLLVAGLVGSIYFVKQQADPKTGTSEIAKQDQPVIKSSDTSSETKKDEKSATDETKKTDSDQSSAETPTAPVAPATDENQSQSEEQIVLPETGPSDIIMSAMVLGITTFAVASYIRSR